MGEFCDFARTKHPRDLLSLEFPADATRTLTMVKESNDAAGAVTTNPLTEDEMSKLKDIVGSLKTSWYMGMEVEKAKNHVKVFFYPRPDPPLPPPTRTHARTHARTHTFPDNVCCVSLSVAAETCCESLQDHLQNHDGEVSDSISICCSIGAGPDLAAVQFKSRYPRAGGLGQCSGRRQAGPRTRCVRRSQTINAEHPPTLWLSFPFMVPGDCAVSICRMSIRCSPPTPHHSHTCCMGMGTSICIRVLGVTKPYAWRPAGSPGTEAEWIRAQELAAVRHMGWHPSLAPWPVLELTKVRSCLKSAP